MIDLYPVPQTCVESSYLPMSTTAQYWGLDAFADGNQVNILQLNLGIPREKGITLTRTRPSPAICSRGHCEINAWEEGG